MELATKAHFHDYEDNTEIDIDLDEFTTESLKLDEVESDAKPQKVLFPIMEQEVSQFGYF